MTHYFKQQIIMYSYYTVYIEILNQSQISVYTLPYYTV